MNKEEKGKREISTELLVSLREAFAEIDRKAESKGGVFSIEARAGELAKKTERVLIEREIETRERGYEGNSRRCPKCGKMTQRYKGDCERVVEFECGEIRFSRAYYVCDKCGESSYPLDEQLGLVPGKEQGKLREKMTMLATVTPYHQAPAMCKTILGSERHATTMRRVMLREARRFEESEEAKGYLPGSANETLYVQIDGHMCPTREERKDATDQGFREAKAVLSYRDSDVVQLTAKRKEILHRMLKAKVCSSTNFLPIVKQVLDQAKAEEAKMVVVLGDGAKWIWNIAEEIIPGAIQILDFSHVKQYLFQFANIRYKHDPQQIRPWVNQQIDCLMKDKVSSVIFEMKQYSNIDKVLDEVTTYFENNKSRTQYGTYKKLGLNIGSGAIESAGKQISVARIKGAGMRWNVVDLNPVLSMRCAFLDSSLQRYWNREKAAA